ncbi:MAG: hypothetical protein AB7H93_14530 [Vicinamibacterales bacterium]
MSAGTATRQFVLLVRQSFRRLQDAALASREIDADQFVLWGAALLATPLLFNTVTWTSRYPWLRRKSLETLHDAVLADRLFFVTWPMLVMWLVGALVWDGLVPDKTDQQVLGVLPVGSRRIAAARLTAAWLAAIVLLAGIVVPPALAYGLAGGAHPSVGPRLGIALGQATASFAAGLFAFSTLLAIRGALVVLVGGAAAARASVVLQLLSVVLLVETFLFLPGLMPAAMHAVEGGGAMGWAPPVWFLGLYAEFAGPRAALLVPTAPIALIALALSIAAAAAAYLLPARLNARRVMEAVEPRQRRQWARRAVVAAGALLPTRPGRAIFAFTMTSVGRNRRALMTLATYLGLGIALAGTRLLSARVRGRPLPLDAPFDYLLAIPLVLTFFLVLGVRAAFAVPSDLGANWILRLAGPRQVRGHAPATHLACAAIAVAPVTLLVLALGAWLWGAGPALRVAAMHAASGLWLVVVAMAGVAAVPFTRAHAMSAESLRVAAPLGVVAVHLYAFRLDDVQTWALTTPAGPWWYVATALLLTVAGAIAGRRWYGRPDTTFEAPSDQAVRLSLSEAGR